MIASARTALDHFIVRYVYRAIRASYRFLAPRAYRAMEALYWFVDQVLFSTDRDDERLINWAMSILISLSFFVFAFAFWRSW